MKKVMMLLVGGLLVGSTPVSAKNSIGVNLANFAVGLIGVQFELGLKNESASIPMRIHTFSFSTGVASISEVKYTAFAIGGSYRIYKKGLIANSFYYGPRFDLLMAKVETIISGVVDAEATGSLIGPGFEVGRAWTFGGKPAGFMVDLTALLSFYVGKVEAKSDSASVATEGFRIGGVVPGVRIAIGYAF